MNSKQIQAKASSERKADTLDLTKLRDRAIAAIDSEDSQQIAIYIINISDYYKSLGYTYTLEKLEDL